MNNNDVSSSLSSRLAQNKELSVNGGNSVKSPLEPCKDLVFSGFLKVSFLYFPVLLKCIKNILDGPR
jgi:hypothetical protein